MKQLKELSLIIFYGATGAGKTTLAEALHNEIPHTARVGSDRIKRFVSDFKTMESVGKISRKVINSMVGEYLRNDISVIVDQNMTREEMEALEAIALENNAKLFIYRLEVDRDISKERVMKRTIETNKSMMSEETTDALHKRHADNAYKNNTAVFDSGKTKTEEMVIKILNDVCYE
jgi:adenylate kinase family enzyme